METLIIGIIIISLLHAIIPSHWLPVLTLSKTQKWSDKETLKITFLLGLAHVISTVILGAIISLLSFQLDKFFEHVFNIVAPVSLIILGIIFIHRHHKHQHFHIDQNQIKQKTKKQIIISLMLVMFFSPCLEVEGYFLLGGKHGLAMVLLLSSIYIVFSIIGMVLWMKIALAGTGKLNWHKIEHNAGLITGIVLIITGILSFFIN